MTLWTRIWSWTQEKAQWWAQRTQTASQQMPMMMSFFQIPDPWRHAWIHLRAASSATFITSTMKPWSKKSRISWKPSHHAPKKFKFKSSEQEFFKRNQASSVYVKNWSIQTTVTLKKTKNQNSKSIWYLKRSLKNSLTKSPKNSSPRLLDNFWQFQTSSGSNIQRWWTKDSHHPK